MIKLSFFLSITLLSVFLTMTGSPQGSSDGTVHLGVWESGTDANYYSTGKSLADFKKLAQERHKKKLRLIDLETHLVNGKRRWAGVWRKGTYANYFSVGLTGSQFKALAQERHKKKLRLVDIETYVEGGKRYWAGVWKSGTDANYYNTNMTGADLNKLATERHKKKLRIIDIETYEAGGQRRWAAVWRSGNYANYYSTGLSLSDLKKLATERHKNKLRIVDLETYTSGGKRYYAGLWKSGNYANYFSVGMDGEYLNAIANERHKKKLRLVDLDFYTTSCQSGCLNDVVMPATVKMKDGTVTTNSGYNYGITRTKTHCPGLPNSCGTPAADEVVYYRWPVNEVGSKRFARLSALKGKDRFLYLPFKNKAVKRNGIWRYGNYGWHHAGDYSISGDKTFEIVASADGTVVHIGWDNWSGNTIVLSHDVGRTKDAYRTIYMHLRNGPVNDCKTSWSQSVPSLSGDTKTQFQDYLKSTGCKNVSKPSPDEAQWGKSSQTINMNLLGKKVKAGDFLAWAGSTGPGGCGCRPSGTGPNTHLHIFWARRDLTDNRWYLVDPYGIYALPDCYPAAVTDKVNTSCARYPVLWRGAKPAYPN